MLYFTVCPASDMMFGTLHLHPRTIGHALQIYGTSVTRTSTSKTTLMTRDTTVLVRLACLSATAL